jgi:hypothetical protein
VPTAGWVVRFQDLNVSDPAATHEPFKVEYKIEVASFYDWSKRKRT